MQARRSFLLTAVAALFLLVAPTAGRASDQDAKVFVDRLANQALEVMTGKGLSDQDRQSRFRTLFVHAVDLPEIGRFVLGRNWRAATPEQQKEFLSLFEDMVVLTWANRFKDYGAGVQHVVTNVVPDGERGVMVESQVRREKQEPITLNWRLRQPDGDFRVVDLMVEGTSMAITYRSDFSAVLQANGNRIDGLLDAMRKKIAQIQAPR